MRIFWTWMQVLGQKNVIFFFFLIIDLLFLYLNHLTENHHEQHIIYSSIPLNFPFLLDLLVFFFTLLESIITFIFLLFSDQLWKYNSFPCPGNPAEPCQLTSLFFYLSVFFTRWTIKRIDTMTSLFLQAFLSKNLLHRQFRRVHN